MYDLINDIDRRGIEGDIVETGCYKRVCVVPLWPTAARKTVLGEIFGFLIPSKDCPYLRRGIVRRLRSPRVKSRLVILELILMM